MIVFSLFEFILGIKRHSFLGFYYNHWYDKWIKSWSSRLSQSPFFLTGWVGPCDIVARSAAAPPSLALEIPSLRFLPSPWRLLRRLLWRLLSSIENFWRVDLEQVYCLANFAFVILGFWAPLAFHNCWGIQFSDGIIIIIFSINVKGLLPSVVRDKWMIDSNIRYVTQGGALNRLRFCT